MLNLEKGKCFNSPPPNPKETSNSAAKKFCQSGLINQIQECGNVKFAYK